MIEPLGKVGPGSYETGVILHPSVTSRYKAPFETTQVRFKDFLVVKDPYQNNNINSKLFHKETNRTTKMFQDSLSGIKKKCQVHDDNLLKNTKHLKKIMEIYNDSVSNSNEYY